jgi:hypothetical protein
MSEKSEAMKNVIESIFPGTKEALANKKCPMCYKPIGIFKDALSEREYEISGLCQDCQDDIFTS